MHCSFSLYKGPPTKAAAGENVAVNQGATRTLRDKTLNTSIDKSFYGNGMDTVTVSPKFQVVIPQEIRERVGIKPGERLVVLQKGDVIYLVRVGNLKSAKGFLEKRISTKGMRDEIERFG